MPELKGRPLPPVANRKLLEKRERKEASAELGIDIRHPSSEDERALKGFEARQAESS
jgi:hypothetical protein